MAEDLLRIDDAAAYIGVNRVKFSRLAKRHTIPYKRDPLDDRVKLFRRADVEFLRQAQRDRGPDGDSSGWAA